MLLSNCWYTNSMLVLFICIWMQACNIAYLNLFFWYQYCWTIEPWSIIKNASVSTSDVEVITTGIFNDVSPPHIWIMQQRKKSPTCVHVSFNVVFYVLYYKQLYLVWYFAFQIVWRRCFSLLWFILKYALMYQVEKPLY